MKTSPELQKAVAEYQKGSVEAFNTLYEQSYKYLHTCVIHVVKNEDMAMDMLQETYLEISRSISQLKSTEDFLSWAAMIANRKCFAHLKKQKDILLDGSGMGDGSESEDNVTDYFENIADSEEFIPETVLQDREKQRLIKEIIDGLNDMQRLCVIGFYYNEQKQEEIAEELGIPVNTVKSHLNRAKAKIKEAVVELDVKKGTRLYSFAPFMLLLFKEEVQACVLRPMSKGLASAVGVSASGVVGSALPGGLEAVKEFITENFGETLGEIFTDTIGKVAVKAKALWTKFTAASIQTKAVVATTACAVTIGGAAAVLSPEDSACTISKDTQGVLDQLIEISEKGNYEEIYDIDFTNFDCANVWISEYGVHLNNDKIDTLEEEKIDKSEYWRDIVLLDDKGKPIVNTVFYDGKHNRLSSDYTGYGMGIQGDSFTIGKFINGKLEGEAVNIWFCHLLYLREYDLSDREYQVTEFTVESNEIIGDTVCTWFGGFQMCERKYTGKVSYVDFDYEWKEINEGGYNILEDGTYEKIMEKDGQYYIYTGEVDTICKGERRGWSNCPSNYPIYLDENGNFDMEKHDVHIREWEEEGLIWGEISLDFCYDEYGNSCSYNLGVYYPDRGGYEFMLPIDIDYIK